ncbi:hypothetical protein Cpir12675_006539 [Ceratocystis pirilliformis]|uniref:Uncharacterized protein n=1 Tax=Ceratocystis pirilliformis TaxID=259994 RepID=A0ABR3YH40_9PEZI
MAAMLCTLAAAERNRAVRYASVLELEFFDSGNGWKQIQGPGDFYAEVFVSREDKYIAVSEMLNPGREYDSYEALLSIWEHESDISAGQLQSIKYYNVNKESDVGIFDDVFASFDYDPNEDYKISDISIERESTIYNHHWKALRTTTFGSDAIDICTEFKETDGFYIQSFDVGRTGYNGRWIRVNFKVDGNDDDDDQ